MDNFPKKFILGSTIVAAFLAIWWFQQTMPSPLVPTLVFVSILFVTVAVAWVRSVNAHTQLALEVKALAEAITEIKDNRDVEQVVAFDRGPVRTLSKSLRATLERFAAQEAERRKIEQARTQELQADYFKAEAATAAAKAEIASLEKTKEQLVKAEKLTGLVSLAAGFAHEFRNPLNYITGHNHNQQKQLDKIRETLWELTQEADGRDEIRDLFDGLFDAAKSTYGSYREGLERVELLLQALAGFVVPKGQMQLEPFDALTPLNAAILNLKAGEVPIDSTLDRMPTIVCNPAMLQATFSEIIKNALYAAEKSSSGTKEAVKIWTAFSDHLIIISIEDSGDGIPQEIKERIFDPFFTTKPPGDGVGMGLTTALAVVEGHNGQLRISNASGGGTLVEIILPTDSHFDVGVDPDEAEVFPDDFVWL